MRFIADQDGIMNRYLREKDHWTSHLDNTKQFILSSFEETTPETVMVLGSGWLLDLPLEEMTKRYKKIYLADVRHPAQVLRKIEKMKNVVPLEFDISGGGIGFCWDLRKQKDDHYKKYILDEFKPQLPEIPKNPDAFISLNILNQLDILLIEFLKNKNARIIETEILRFRKKIQKFHLDWITTRPGCLIADIAEMNYKPGEETTEDKLVHVALPKAKRTEEWTWDFDMSKMYRPGFETRLKVKALEW